MCGTVKTLFDNEKEITALSETSLTSLKKVYGNLFKKYRSLLKVYFWYWKKFLSDIDLAIISDENYAKCETENTHDNRLLALKSIPNNKTAGNDGLCKEFYETFWDYIKYVFINPSKLAKVGGT